VVGTPQLGGILVHYDAPNGVQFTNAGPCSIQTALISSLFHFLLFTDVLLCLQQCIAMQEKCTMNRKKMLFRMCGPLICGGGACLAMHYGHSEIWLCLNGERTDLYQDRVSVVPLVIHRRHRRGVRWTTRQISGQLPRPAAPAHVLAPAQDTVTRTTLTGNHYIYSYTLAQASSTVLTSVPQQKGLP